MKTTLLLNRVAKVATALTAALTLSFVPATAAADPSTSTLNQRNVILITSDGLRWQEVFRGANPAMYTELHNVTTPTLAEKRFGTTETTNRRDLLLPFLWQTAAARGQLYGNRDKGSIARVTNERWFSYPGYNELLTRLPDNSIASNRKIPNKNISVLEWLNNKPELKGKVVAFTRWDAFPAILNTTRSGLKVESGIPDPYDTYKKYLLEHKPRVSFVAFGATDGFGHAGKYYDYLDAAHTVDNHMADLWQTLQSMPEYKDNTTIIYTADHGRGNSKTGPKSWNSHARNVPESDSLYLVIWGPDTPHRGEVEQGEEVTQAQVAATVAQALGYDYPAEQPKAAPPIKGAIKPAK